ncbi:hypothetical protein [Bacillus sp. 22-7]|nr:hypothetical protein [Bacillus sp. 22-7]
MKRVRKAIIPAAGLGLGFYLLNLVQRVVKVILNRTFAFTSDNYKIFNS